MLGFIQVLPGLWYTKKQVSYELFRNPEMQILVKEGYFLCNECRGILMITAELPLAKGSPSHRAPIQNSFSRDLKKGPPFIKNETLRKAMAYEN